ncbi:hypothetical protein [Bacteriophage sp.]|nr:hypothetical protein [Bacteriophage sp.]UOF80100.1 hypothetical protein [Bacteriophage sp.]
MWTCSATGSHCSFLSRVRHLGPGGSRGSRSGTTARTRSGTRRGRPARCRATTRPGPRKRPLLRGALPDR